ncbi:MAG: hypothetical protein KBT01_07740 [Clostridiales bacterium]|nr:hypothetical protein [Candidatus Blautia equi]
MSEVKSFLEMSNRELFCVLTGDRDVMAQMALQKIIRKYMKEYPDRDADLMTMVKVIAEEE